MFPIGQNVFPLGPNLSVGAPNPVSTGAVPPTPPLTGPAAQRPHSITMYNVFLPATVIFNTFPADQQGTGS